MNKCLGQAWYTGGYTGRQKCPCGCAMYTFKRSSCLKNHVFQQVFVHLRDCVCVVRSPFYFASRLRQLPGNSTAATTTCRGTGIMQLCLMLFVTERRLSPESCFWSIILGLYKTVIYKCLKYKEITEYICCCTDWNTLTLSKSHSVGGCFDKKWWRTDIKSKLFVLRPICFHLLLSYNRKAE